MAGNPEGCAELLRWRRARSATSSRWLAHDGRFRLKRQGPRRWQPEAHWRREKVSLAPTEPHHVGFIFRDPLRHLFAREPSRFGHPSALRAKPGGEKQQEFLLLLRRQGIRGCFDLDECAHVRDSRIRLRKQQASARRLGWGT